MAKKPSFNFSEDWFYKNNFSKNPDGSWSRAPLKSEFVRLTKAKNILEETELVVKEKVNNSPDFNSAPTTEWFIKNYNVPSKKNSRQNFVKNGKQISIPSKNHAEYVKMTAMQYQIFGLEFKKTVEIMELSYPLRVQFTFVRNSKRRWDYCNACQTVEDLMVSNNWLPDDSADYLIPVFGRYEYDKECAGVKIKLLLTK